MFIYLSTSEILWILCSFKQTLNKPITDFYCTNIIKLKIIISISEKGLFISHNTFINQMKILVEPRFSSLKIQTDVNHNKTSITQNPDSIFRTFMFYCKKELVH